MASLTFLFNQMSSLASTLTPSFVIVWCSCAQCSPTAVSGFLMLRWCFILVASILPISPMYTVCERAFREFHMVYQTTFMGVRCFVVREYQDGSNGGNGPMAICALNTRESDSEVPCMYGKPTLVLGMVPVDEVLCCCLGIGTLNIHWLYPLVFRAYWTWAISVLRQSGRMTMTSARLVGVLTTDILCCRWWLELTFNIGLCGWVYGTMWHVYSRPRWYLRRHLELRSDRLMPDNHVG